MKDSGAALLLNESHASKQLLALATHPTDPDLYATAGDDGAVRIWSVSLRRCLSRSSPDLVGAAIRAMAWYVGPTLTTTNNDNYHYLRNTIITRYPDT